MFSDFLRVLSNGETRTTYRRFIKGLVVDPDGFLDLAKSDKKAAGDMLLERVLQRREEIAPTTLRTTVASLRSFLEFEEVELNFKKIRRAMPPSRSVGRDKPPTIEEIRRLLEVCDRRMRAVVFVMCSSGIRVGAFNYLDVGDYKRLDDGVGRLRVYKGTPEAYIAFITPEACQAVDTYFEERRKSI